MTTPKVEAIEPNVLWWEITADFLCSCEGATDINDCTLPYRITCEKCGKTWRLKVLIEEEPA